MRLDKDTVIAGQPIRRIRELLHRIGDAHWSHPQIANFFQINAAQARAFIDDMSRRGLLEECQRPPGDSDQFYACGPKGARFRSARLLKPITRRKADAIIAALLQRVQRINERAELLERVCEIRVFGSYLEDRDDLGDVDIAVKTERKEASGKDWVQDAPTESQQPVFVPAYDG